LEYQCAARGAEGDVLTGEFEQNSAAKFTQGTVALVCLHAHVDGVDGLAAVDLVDAENFRISEQDVFELGVGTELACQLLEQSYDAVGVFAGVDAERKGGDGEVSREVGDGCYLTIGDDIERAVTIAKLGEAQGKVFDGTLKACDFDHVAYVVLVFNEDEEAIKDVFKDGLRAEADAKAYYSGRGDEGSSRDADGAKDLNEDIKREQAVSGGSDDAGERAQLGRAMAYGALGAFAHAADEECDDSPEDKGDQECDKYLGKTILGEVDQGFVPAVTDGWERSLVLWIGRQKVHHVRTHRSSRIKGAQGTLTGGRVCREGAKMRTHLVVAGTALCMLFVAPIGGIERGAIAAAQSQSTTPTIKNPRLPSTDTSPDLQNPDPSPYKERMEANAVKSRNTDRHKRLVDDTTKLLALSNELKAEVDKSTKDELSISVIQKAAEIERLARDVKERMKG
jgi:hypothetical protein